MPMIHESHLIDNNDSNNNDMIMSDDVNASNLDKALLDDQPTNNKSSSSPEVELFRGSIAERRAAKFGFNASRINGAQVTISSPPSSEPSPARSPYLTIPAGISPAALLESPVMLFNSQVQPSPTTGTYPLPSCNNDSLRLLKSISPPSADRGSNGAIDSLAEFKPPADPTQLPCASSVVENLPQTASKSPVGLTKDASIKSYALETSTETNVAANITWKTSHVDLQPRHTDIADNQVPQPRESIKGEIGAPHLLEVDQKGSYPSSGMTRNAEDGYCWRKYGQKHVKGSEYPRSYYKCNNSNCPVKKKVERSHDGEITEIIYKGAHNHPKPHPRLSLVHPALSTEVLETSEGSGSCHKEGGAAWRLNHLRTQEFRTGADWTADGLERTSSASILNEISDPSATSQAKSVSLFGSVETRELATAIANQDGEDQERGTQGSTSPGDDAEGDESEPKRRKKENFSTEAYLPSRSTREPRIILQIESEIDVLDDGYRWRKYGQKVVKGNPNPRSYYKCTSAGCPVRKHVERASEDIKSVITTYEGKHNHEVPTTKTSAGAASVGNSPPNVSDPNSLLTLPRNPNVSNPEMQVQDFPLHYQMKPALGNEFVRSNLINDLVSDMKIGAPSMYQMKFPPMQSPMPYSPFLMNSSGGESHTSSIGAPVVPEFSMMSIPRPTNMTLSSFHSSNHPRLNGAVQSTTGSQQIKESDSRFFKPKEEQKEDSLYDTCMATPDNANATSTTVFCRAIGNFPS